MGWGWPSPYVEELGLAVALPLSCSFHPLDLILPEAGSPLVRIRAPDVLGLRTPLCVLASLRRMVQVLGSLHCSMKVKYSSPVFLTSKSPALVPMSSSLKHWSLDSPAGSSFSRRLLLLAPSLWEVPDAGSSRCWKLLLPLAPASHWLCMGLPSRMEAVLVALVQDLPLSSSGVFSLSSPFSRISDS